MMNEKHELFCTAFLNVMEENSKDLRMAGVLESWDGMGKAKAPPFFAAKVIGKIERASEQEETNFFDRAMAFFARPAVAFCLSVFVLAANGTILSNLFAKPGQTTVDTANNNKENNDGLKAYAESLGLSETTTTTDQKTMQD